MSVSEAEWEYRMEKHMRVCAIEKGILTHIHTDYGGVRWEDPHPWPCEEIDASGYGSGDAAGTSGN